MKVNVREARKRLATILDAAAAGEEVLIERHDEAFELRLKRTTGPRRLPRLDGLRESGRRDSMTAAERLSEDRER